MKKFSKIFLLFSVVTFVLTVLPNIGFAQIGDPGCDPYCNCREDMSVCPIDNGVWILLAIGIAYGFKQLLDIRRRKIAAR